MQKADFYILNASDPLPFLGRLIDKLYKTGHKAYVHCDNAAMAENLDDFLWAFDEASFIPHQILAPEMEELPPVILGSDPKAPYPYENLIIFGDSLPETFPIYPRILYVVSEPYKAKAREYYSHLKEQGYEISTHKM